MQSAAGWPIRLGQYKDDFLPCGHEARQRALCECGRAGEN
jgi:hypothetical protein